jgi:ABC-2 type transport system ATP-binding protein
VGDGWQEWDVELDAGVTAGDILQLCTEQSVPLRRFDERRASLHDVFLQIVGPPEARQ